jgi:uncharacterized protein (DUF1778 family)
VIVGDFVKEERLYLRVSTSQKKLLADAAELGHTSISEFALSSMLSEAERRILDQRVFHVGAEAFADLNALLNSGPNNNPAAKKTMSHVAPWES